MIALRKNHALLIILFISFFQQSPERAFAQDGSAGQPGEFLRYAVGARASGMGRAFTAVANDASSIFWNPAGLMNLERQEFSSMYTNLFFDSYFTYVSLGIPRKYLGENSAFGIGWVRYGVADFEQRSINNEPQGEFELYEQAFVASYAREHVPASSIFKSWGILSYGVSLKLVNQAFPGYDANKGPVSVNRTSAFGVGLDVGATFLPINAPVFRIFALRYLMPLRLGLSVQNLLPPRVGIGRKDRYPQVLRWGLGYDLNFKRWQFKLAYDQEFDLLIDEQFSRRDLGHYAGLEVEFSGQRFKPVLRMGANNRSDKFTIGAGIKVFFQDLTAVRIDYSRGQHDRLSDDDRLFVTAQFGNLFDADYFYGKTTSRNRKAHQNLADHLHVISQYPNEHVEFSADTLASTYDPNNAARYYWLIGGIKLANIFFREAKSNLKDGKLKEAKDKAYLAVVEYGREFAKPENKFSNTDFLNFAEALIIYEKWHDAIVVLENVFEYTLRYHYLSGVCSARMEKWDDAIKQFRNALDLDVDHNSMQRLSYFGLAKCLMKKGNYESAIDTLRIITRYFCTKLNPEYPRYPIYPDYNICDDAQFLLGQCYLEQGRKEEALIEFAKVTKYYPSLEKSFDGSALTETTSLIIQFLNQTEGYIP
jgi:tetratricopeptide (TPR) repeat protein